MIPVASLAGRGVLAAVIGLAVLLPAGARAASFDCRNPASAFQRTVCNDPALSALATEVETYRRDMANIPWRRGLRDRHDAAMTALRQNAAEDAAAIRRGLEARLAALRVENGWSTTHGLEEAPERRLRTTCLALPSSEGAVAQRRACRVAAFGVLGTVDGRRLAFAQYEYPPDATGELPHEAAVLVFSAGQPGEWTVDLAERLSEANCQRPRLIRQGQDSLLHIPCAETGTSGGPVPLLYRRAGPASFRIWQDIDAEAWLATLPQHIPTGMEIRGATTLDPERMTAGFRLWRGTDPDASPAGQAEARLTIENDRLIVREVTVRPVASPPPRR